MSEQVKEINVAFDIWWQDQDGALRSMDQKHIANVAWLNGAIKGIELDKSKVAPSARQHHVVTDGKTYRIKYPGGAVGSCEYSLEEARAAVTRLEYESKAEWKEIE